MPVNTADLLPAHFVPPADNGAVWPGFDSFANEARLDHFVERDGRRFAGSHLLLDCWGGGPYDNLVSMERALREAVAAAGATLLHIHLHHFTPNGGVSGVAVLAESHISVHTWPENGFAAFDVFMCGDARPFRAVQILKQAFRPDSAALHEHLRGLESHR